jgi:lysophospholipase L1-like esterase
MEKSSWARIRRVITNLLLSVLSTLVSLSLVEQILKATHFQADPLHIDVANKSDARYYHVFEDHQFIFDPQLIWRPKPGFGFFNSQGFRGVELPSTKIPASYRIFAIGDSNTLGWAGKASCWPAYLQNVLLKTGKHAAVINAGVYGYSSYQGLQRFRECLLYQPDLVLISFGANDAHQVSISDREFVQSGISNVRLRQFLYRYRLGKLLLLTLSRSSTSHIGQLKPRVDQAEYRRNLAEIARTAKQKRIQVVFLTRPYLGSSNNPQIWKSYAPQYNQATADVARHEGVLLIDVYSYFKDKRQYFADESHFTMRGHRVAAGIIEKALLPLLPK